VRSPRKNERRGEGENGPLGGGDEKKNGLSEKKFQRKERSLSSAEARTQSSGGRTEVTRIKGLATMWEKKHCKKTDAFWQRKERGVQARGSLGSKGPC